MLMIDMIRWLPASGNPNPLLALEIPDGGSHQVLAMRVVEGELLQGWQWQSSIDDAIIETNHLEQPGTDQSLRKASTFQVNINNWTHWTIVTDLHQEFRRISQSHLGLFDRWSMIMIIHRTFCSQTCKFKLIILKHTYIKTYNMALLIWLKYIDGDRERQTGEQ